MTAVAAPGGASRRSNRTLVVWSLAAGVLFLGSAGLQAIAAFERWVLLSAAWTRDQISIEDHRFDYSYPADPWEAIGSTAQLHGAGVLLIALGVLATSRAVPNPDTAAQRVLVSTVAVSFASSGGHAFVSGVTGAPTVLQFSPLVFLLGVVGVVGLSALAVRWSRHSWSASVACLFLLGNTFLGYLLVASHIAPVIAGYRSHDTTPWTEAVVAVTTGAAGLVLLIAAFVGAVAHHGSDSISASRPAGRARPLSSGEPAM